MKIPSDVVQAWLAFSSDIFPWPNFVGHVVLISSLKYELVQLTYRLLLMVERDMLGVGC